MDRLHVIVAVCHALCGKYEPMYHGRVVSRLFFGSSNQEPQARASQVESAAREYRHHAVDSSLSSLD